MGSRDEILGDFPALLPLAVAFSIRENLSF